MQILYAFGDRIPFCRIPVVFGYPVMGVYCQVYFPQRLSNEFVLSTHPVRSHMCSSLLRLVPEKLQARLGRAKREIQAITEEFSFAWRDHRGLRNFACSSPWAQASVCRCIVSQHPCLCRSFPLPHTTVCPRGFCRARTRPRAHSWPSRDINYTVQRVGVYLRCLRQVAGKDWSKAL